MALTIFEYIKEKNINIEPFLIDNFYHHISNDDLIYLTDDLICWIGYKITNIVDSKSKIKQFLIDMKCEYGPNIQYYFDYSNKEYFEFRKSKTSSLTSDIKFANKNTLDTLFPPLKTGPGYNTKRHILLTGDALKRILMKINTPRACQVRTYYIEFEKVCKEYFIYQAQNTATKINEPSMPLLLEMPVYHDFDINKFINKSCLYLLHLINAKNTANLYKFGISDNIDERLKTHRGEFKKQNYEVKIVNIWNCLNHENSRLLERKLKKHCLYKELTSLVVSKQTEIIETDSIKLIISLIDEYLQEIIDGDDIKLDILREQNRTIELNNQILCENIKLQMLQEQTKLQLSQNAMTLELRRMELEYEFKKLELTTLNNHKKIDSTTQIIDQPSINNDIMVDHSVLPAAVNDVLIPPIVLPAPESRLQRPPGYSTYSDKKKCACDYIIAHPPPLDNTPRVYRQAHKDARPRTYAGSLEFAQVMLDMGFVQRRDHCKIRRWRQ